MVYTTFLKKQNVLSYGQGMNYLSATNATIYLFTDNLHPWITNQFIPKEGIISLVVSTSIGGTVTVTFFPELIWETEYKKGDMRYNASIWKIDGFSISP